MEQQPSVAVQSGESQAESWVASSEVSTDSVELHEIPLAEQKTERALGGAALKEAIAFGDATELEASVRDEATVRDLGSLALEYTAPVEGADTQKEVSIEEGSEEEIDLRFEAYWARAQAVMDALLAGRGDRALDALPATYQDLLSDTIARNREWYGGEIDTFPQIELARMNRLAAIGFSAKELGEGAWYPAEP